MRCRCSDACIKSERTRAFPVSSSSSLPPDASPAGSTRFARSPIACPSLPLSLHRHVPGPGKAWRRRRRRGTSSTSSSAAASRRGTRPGSSPSRGSNPGSSPSSPRNRFVLYYLPTSATCIIPPRNSIDLHCTATPPNLGPPCPPPSRVIRLLVRDLPCDSIVVTFFHLPSRLNPLEFGREISKFCLRFHFTQGNSCRELALLIPLSILSS